MDAEVAIIFLTSSEEHILEGYRVYAAGYFIKPLAENKEEFTEALDHTFTVGDAPVFQGEELGNGVYGYCFEFVTPTDDSAMSRMVQFTLENGEITTTIEEL